MDENRLEIAALKMKETNQINSWSQDFFTFFLSTIQEKDGSRKQLLFHSNLMGQQCFICWEVFSVCIHDDVDR